MMMFCKVNWSRLPYARDIVLECLVLRQLKKEDHPLWKIISHNPELISQRDAELCNKRMQMMQGYTNVRLISIELK